MSGRRIKIKQRDVRQRDGRWLKIGDRQWEEQKESRRLLGFVGWPDKMQNVNSAMEASRKSRIAFAASSSKEEAVVSAIKRALDFDFHDVEELLHRVRVAMELINREHKSNKLQAVL
ncbi:hypothetical protein L1987_13089 [Smallanthus sonchifolius]|uniref:Uncharacterized protein n=1 Tax=Smallanthus sonchifolius TaxID=185202 RepID=A0ACB9JFI7_9ASTR|nr:hypothetical protein L1987_13089 [Smallanthus sonchifolius]